MVVAAGRRLVGSYRFDSGLGLKRLQLNSTERDALRKLSRLHQGADLVAEYNCWAICNGQRTRQPETIAASLQLLLTQRASHWHRDEIEELKRLAGETPFDDVVRRHRRWAKRAGFPPRTAEGLAKQLGKMGLSYRPEGDWIAIATIRRITGRGSKAIQGWIRAGGMRVGGRAGTRCLWRRQIVQLAKQRPHLFAGIDRPALMYLLEDEDLAESIARDHPQRQACWNHGRAVIVVEMGRRFESMAAAAKACYLERHGVARAVREGRSAGGYTFRRAD